MTAYDYHRAIKENRERLEALERKVSSTADHDSTERKVQIPARVYEGIHEALLFTELSSTSGRMSKNMHAIAWLEDNAEPEG